MSHDTSTKIFVGGLPPATNDESLAAYWAQYEPVEAIVMMDKMTGRSRGFGFVVFPSPAHVQSALSVQHTIDGKAVEVKACVSREEAREAGMSGKPPPYANNWQQPNSFAQVAPRGGFGGACGSSAPAEGGGQIANKLFVGGLAPSTTDETLVAYFQQFGEVECVVMMDKFTGRSRGFGFATFANAEAAQLALQSGAANGNESEHTIDGKVVSARICEERGSRPPQGNFGGAGNMNSGCGGCGGMGGAPPAAMALTNALQTLQQSLNSLSGPGNVGGNFNEGQQQQQQFGNNFGGGAGGGGFGGKGGPPTDVSTRIFCGGLPQTCDDTKLHTYFSSYGTLTDAKVMFDRSTGRSRGFGYVSFADAEACESVLQTSHMIDDKPIEVKPCEERGSAALATRQQQQPQQGYGPARTGFQGSFGGGCGGCAGCGGCGGGFNPGMMQQMGGANAMGCGCGMAQMQQQQMQQDPQNGNVMGLLATLLPSLMQGQGSYGTQAMMQPDNQAALAQVLGPVLAQLQNSQGPAGGNRFAPY
mmetsp:Transcript_7707/g.16885  ORF Transcript_7707/g.16885 Transcript_7707/m.16885 type:complete len:531 (-) Transcript_7707:121-1713(-)